MQCRDGQRDTQRADAEQQDCRRGIHSVKQRWTPVRPVVRRDGLHPFQVRILVAQRIEDVAHHGHPGAGGDAVDPPAADGPG